MTDKQSEALRLADALLETVPKINDWNEAAAELRRLHEENETMRTRLSQCERCGEVNPAEIHTCSPQEPVAWIEFDSFMDEDGLMSKRKIVNTWDNGRGEPLYTAPPHFIDPTKVARLMDEAFERGKKEINMEQVKDIVQKLSDSAALNSVPMGWVKKKEWVGLTDEDWIIGKRSADYIAGAEWAEAKLKEKNT